MQNNYHDNTKKIKEQSSSTSLVSIQFYLVQQSVLIAEYPGPGSLAGTVNLTPNFNVRQ